MTWGTEGQSAAGPGPSPFQGEAVGHRWQHLEGFRIYSSAHRADPRPLTAGTAMCYSSVSGQDPLLLMETTRL